MEEEIKLMASEAHIELNDQSLDDPRKILGENLLFYLEKIGKTQVELAADIGVNKSTFNEWVKGNKYPRIDKIEKLAEYFGITKSDLIEKRETTMVCNKKDSRAVFAKNLNHLLEARGISRKEASDSIDVSYFTFTSWCNGTKYPRIDKIEKLAEYFGVELSELVEKRETIEKNNKMDSRTVFAKNLHYLMEVNNVSRKEVSAAIDVSYYTFTDWCNGRKYPRIESIELLADYFAVSVPELVGDMDIDQENHAETRKNNDVQLVIGHRIKNRRKELSLSADELGARIGKDRATVYRYESGSIENMPIGLLAPLAEALDVSVEYLIGTAETQKSKPIPTKTPDVLDIVVRLHTDTQFLKIVEKMSKLDEHKLNALQQFLKAFGD